MLKDIDFTEKTVIVTGGTKGIGAGCAELFCEANANVVICARDEKRGQDYAAELCDTFGTDRCTFVQCNVMKEAEIKHVVDFTIQKFGRLDSIINNAGYHPPEEEIDDITAEMFEELLRLNLISIFLFCKYALPHLRKTKGSIVNMSSLVGSMGQKRAMRYISTKGAITSLTKALAVDEGPNGVRVNCVSPGSIDSPLTTEYFANTDDPEGEYQKTCNCSPFRRIGTMRETAGACLFLASDLAGFMTGQDIKVSGGAELAYGVKF